MPTVFICNYFVIFDPGFPLDSAFCFPYHDDWVILIPQGHQLCVHVEGVMFYPHVTAESVSPPQPSHEEKGKEIIQSDQAMFGSSQDHMEMLRSGIPVEPLGIEHMDWVKDPEDGISLRCMVSANNIYYENDDTAVSIEQSPFNAMMGHLKIT